MLAALPEVHCTTHCLLHRLPLQQAWAFCKPVSAKTVPDYHRLIKFPMDLQTMKEVTGTARANSFSYLPSFSLHFAVMAISLSCVSKETTRLSHDYTRPMDLDTMKKVSSVWRDTALQLTLLCNGCSTVSVTIISVEKSFWLTWSR